MSDSKARFPELDKAMTAYQTAVAELSELNERIHQLDTEVRQMRREQSNKSDTVGKAQKALVGAINQCSPGHQIHLDDECQVRGVMES